MNGMRDFRPDDEKQLDFIRFNINADLTTSHSLDQLEGTKRHHFRNVEALYDYGIITYPTWVELRDYITTISKRAQFALREAEND